MNTLQFNSAGLEEMTFAEMQEIDGGVPVLLPVLGAMALVVFTEVVQDWNNFKAGLTGGCPKAKN